MPGHDHALEVLKRDFPAMKYSIDETMRDAAKRGTLGADARRGTYQLRTIRRRKDRS